MRDIIIHQKNRLYIIILLVATWGAIYLIAQLAFDSINVFKSTNREVYIAIKDNLIYIDNKPLDIRTIKKACILKYSPRYGCSFSVERIQEDIPLIILNKRSNVSCESLGTFQVNNIDNLLIDEPIDLNTLVWLKVVNDKVFENDNPLESNGRLLLLKKTRIVYILILMPFCMFSLILVGLLFSFKSRKDSWINKII